MRLNEKKSNESIFGTRILSLLAMICICCAAMAPVVAALPWIPGANRSVDANNDPYDYFDGTLYYNYSFFAVCGNAGFGYNWTTDPRYSDRKPLYNLTIDGQLYPPSGIPPTDYKWNIVDGLDQNAYLYKKGLAGYVNSSIPYYLWYGNDTAARTGTRLYPTVENATYLVKLDVTYTP